MDFVLGGVIGAVLGLVVGAYFSQKDLNDCAKKHDVYECELVAVPKGDDDGVATE